MRNLLYYPTILIPSEWIKKSILYTDKISSIHPYGFSPSEGYKESLAYSDMLYLKSMGLYEFSRPESLSDFHFKIILNELQNYVTEKKMSILRTRFADKSLSKYEIYNAKMDYEIRRYLLKNKLAERFPENDSLLVEFSLGYKYMSLLAAYSSNSRNKYITATNDLAYRDNLFEYSETESNSMAINITMNKLPTPSDVTSLQDIILFKEEYREDLLHFRKFLNKWQMKISRNPSVDVIMAFEDEYERYSIEVLSMYKSSKIQVDYSSLDILLPFLSSTLTAKLLGALDKDAVLIGGASIGTSLLMKSVKSHIDKRKKRVDSPMNYVYRIDTELTL